jgi:DNA polymerase/3'-5' exonuclease PolX
MNSSSITDYILKLEKENAESRTKIEQLKKLYTQSEEERTIAVEKLLDSEIQRVGAVLNEPSLFETTARTKTFQLNEDIAKHLKELGEMTSDFYKTAAYRRAADIVATLDYEVENGESLMNLKGIGKSIAARIDDFINEYYTDVESVASNEGQILEESDDESDDDDFFISYNSELADVLDSLAYHEEDEYKSMAYDRAANIIDQLPFKATSGKELKKVKGIGKSIAKIIDEFLSTGKVKKLERLEKGASTNEEVARALSDYADDLKDPFKVRAYKNAAKNIRELDFEVTNGQELCTGPKKVKGIGKSIANRIDTFLQTGEINP